MYQLNVPSESDLYDRRFKRSDQRKIDLVLNANALAEEGGLAREVASYLRGW